MKKDMQLEGKPVKSGLNPVNAPKPASLGSAVKSPSNKRGKM